MNYRRILSSITVAILLAVGLVFASSGSVAAYDGCPTGSPGGQGYPIIADKLGAGPSTFAPGIGSGHINWTLAAYGHTGACVMYKLTIQETSFAGTFSATYFNFVRVWTCGNYRGSFGGSGTNSAGILSVIVGPFSYHATFGGCALQADDSGSSWSSALASPSPQSLYLNF